MYAIAFDMLIAQLVRNYGEPYNNAFKVEDWSDFTESVKHPENNLRNISKRRPMKK